MKPPRSVEKEFVDGILDDPIKPFLQILSCHRAASYNLPFVCLNVIQLKPLLSYQHGELKLGVLCSRSFALPSHPHSFTTQEIQINGDLPSESHQCSCSLPHRSCSQISKHLPPSNAACPSGSGNRWCMRNQGCIDLPPRVTSQPALLGNLPCVSDQCYQPPR
jgi:hypothetical protein